MKWLRSAALALAGIALAPPADAQHTAGSGPLTLAEARQVMRAEHGGGTYWKLAAERFEFSDDSGKAGVWDIGGWYGGDIHRLRIETEGKYESGTLDHGDLQVFYSRATSAFWDLKFGLRQDLGDESDRTWAAVGVEGMAPFWLETDAVLYLGENGSAFFTLEAEYELLITQRWMLLPRLEWEQRLSDGGNDELSNSLAVGARLGFNGNPQFAPYVGAEWSRSEGRSDTALVAGIRFWF